MRLDKTSKSTRCQTSPPLSFLPPPVFSFHKIMRALLLVAYLLPTLSFTPTPQHVQMHTKCNRVGAITLLSASAPRNKNHEDDAIISRRNALSHVASAAMGICSTIITNDLANADVATKAELSVTSKVSTSPPKSSAPTVLAPPKNNKLENPGDTKNCKDFASYKEAKAWFDKYYDEYGDVAKLDKNNNLIPCESLPGAPSNLKTEK